MKTPYRLSVPIQVRFRDTDAMGHVNNAVYLTYLEMARTAYWTKLFDIESYNDTDFILAHATIDFVAPIFVQDEVAVLIRVSDIGRRSFRFVYEIVRLPGDQVVARAESVQAMYDYAAHKTKRISDEQRARILEFEDADAVTVRA